MNTSMKSRLYAALTVTLIVAGVSQTASAQERRTTIITTTPLVALSTTTGVVMTVMDSTTSTTSSTRDILFGSVEHTTSYLANNCAEVDQSLALGSGGALEDLAQMANIEQRDRGAFYELLHAHRVELSSLLNAPDFNARHAVAMTRLISEAMQRHERLAAYVPG